MIEIVNRYTKAVLYKFDATDMRSAVLAAIAAGANLSWANLREADLSGAHLSGAKMPGFAGQVPASLREAAQKTKEWLAEKRWIQRDWIITPKGAYSGECVACLHGAAVYVGGPEFGPALSARLAELGYTTAWNDADGRTIAEVCVALDKAGEPKARATKGGD